MASFHCFQLQVAAPTLGTSGPTPFNAPGESAPGSEEGDLDPAETAANSRKTGSFNYDREKGGYVHEWASLAEFDSWRRQEELTYSIELVISKTLVGWLFTQKRTYICSCQQTGGNRYYQKKFPDRNQKIESKKTGCSCHITIKLYPHTPTILGRYEADHDHEIGLANIAYTRISHPAREKIHTMLTQKMDRKEIICKRSYSSIIDLTHQ